MTKLEELKARKAEIEELIKREEDAAKVNKAAMFVREIARVNNTSRIIDIMRKANEEKLQQRENER